MHHSATVDSRSVSAPHLSRLAADENLKRRASPGHAVRGGLLTGGPRWAGDATVVRAALGATSAHDAGLAGGTGNGVGAGDPAVAVIAPGAAAADTTGASVAAAAGPGASRTGMTPGTSAADTTGASVAAAAGPSASRTGVAAGTAGPSASTGSTALAPGAAAGTSAAVTTRTTTRAAGRARAAGGPTATGSAASARRATPGCDPDTQGHDDDQECSHGPDAQQLLDQAKVPQQCTWQGRHPQNPEGRIEKPDPRVGLRRRSSGRGSDPR